MFNDLLKVFVALATIIAGAKVGAKIGEKINNGIDSILK